ncbi:MAG: DUF47 domain-containing protein [Chloroflexi bacterium]|nr:DUF47 domain-containing protein [Chloroflexota bacterium]
MRISPFSREDKFFHLLRQSAANVAESGRALVDLMESYENVPEKVAEIKRLEGVGDEIIHTIMGSLHRTFVTPLDREDIALLAERLDDVVDAIEEAARDMLEFRIEEPTQKARDLARIVLQCGEALERAMGYLRYGGARLSAIMPIKDELNVLEDQADQITSHAMAELFESNSLVYVLKWKSVYGQLEGATDRCEDLAGILEGIVIKHE